MTRYTPDQETINRMLDATKPTTALLVRSHALLELLYASGLRLAEIRSLEYDVNAGTSRTGRCIGRWVMHG